eukprot:CAMPEP_0118697424 /NCGR_PEP_ID=MMETSP0800-20121206/14498_1 /TAXON_ID=210618 ORGANISM="Striatella unipunctata, Strain CCMP2910" /NCGR_SAMPLE_ID=MMETSP0800 /ASSEMBLY_ACC=CAM_ASM_000638 /LENGTH=124 /DNA_ID=CAMNT_0006596853 /DNA_START=167 /DNA_END=538 /DNA_ORIENTATION=+
MAQAVRQGDIATLRKIHDEGCSLERRNRFGESLLHMACRRGYSEIVKFFISDAGVNVRIKDDFGRNPLHDAFWTPTPNFDLVEDLLSECPQLLFITDKRGHAPIDYARRSDWTVWREFIDSNLD